MAVSTAMLLVPSRSAEIVGAPADPGVAVAAASGGIELEELEGIKECP